MTCLTVTPESADEAIETSGRSDRHASPIFFRGIKRLTDESPEGRMLLGLVRRRVAVFSPHTAFDNTRDGINDLLARRLLLTEVVPLRRSAERGHIKVVVFVPEKDMTSSSRCHVRCRSGQHWGVSRVQFSSSWRWYFLRLRRD